MIVRSSSVFVARLWHPVRYLRSGSRSVCFESWIRPLGQLPTQTKYFNLQCVFPHPTEQFQERKFSRSPFFQIAGFLIKGILEMMIRVTINGEKLLQLLRRGFSITDISDVELLKLKLGSQLACRPSEVAVQNVSELSHTLGDSRANRIVGGKDLQVSSLELKKSVFESTLVTSIHLNCAATVIYGTDGNINKKCIPAELIPQLVQLASFLCKNFVFQTVPSLTVLFFRYSQDNTITWTRATAVASHSCKFMTEVKFLKLICSTTILTSQCH